VKSLLFAWVLLVLPGTAAAQFKTGEQVVGNVKECYYNYLGKTYVYTVASYGICPLSVNVNPTPAPPAPSGAMAFKTGENLRDGVKDCFYSALGRNYVLTVGPYQLCPLSVPVR
jgi:hypothetical protein